MSCRSRSKGVRVVMSEQEREREQQPAVPPNLEPQAEAFWPYEAVRVMTHRARP
jgi:hypothetical protein